jgi:hypothetical protein
MWLPTPIYERLPQFWLLLGLLFMSSGTYLGFDFSLSFAYFGVGFACCVWSVWVFTMRIRHRKDAKQEATAESTAAEQPQAEPTQADDVAHGAEPVA